MLYGGIGADNKPLNDAWVLDLEKPAWSLIYMAHSDLCPPQVFLRSLTLLAVVHLRLVSSTVCIHRLTDKLCNLKPFHFASAGCRTESK